MFPKLELAEEKRKEINRHLRIARDCLLKQLATEQEEGRQIAALRLKLPVIDLRKTPLKILLKIRVWLKKIYLEVDADGIEKDIIDLEKMIRKCDRALVYLTIGDYKKAISILQKLKWKLLLKTCVLYWTVKWRPAVAQELELTDQAFYSLSDAQTLLTILQENPEGPTQFLQAKGSEPVLFA